LKKHNSHFLYLELHFLVILFGFTAILGKLIHVSAINVVLYRTFFASIGLWVLLLFFKQKIVIAPKDTLMLMATGLVVFFHWYLFFEAARISNVSISVVGLATSTLWVALLQPFFDKTKIRFLEIVLGIAVIVGLYLIFQTQLNQWVGLLLSIGSAILQAVFSIINSRFTQKYPSLVITFYEMIGAMFFTLFFLFILPIGISKTDFEFEIPQNADWLWLLILALACTVYAYSGVVRLLKHISAFTANLAINLEPVYGIIFAYFIFGDSEKMTFGFYAGTTIICAAVFGYQTFGVRK
jgi:drug/metabolite transporter (DMT)-like permease